MNKKNNSLVIEQPKPIRKQVYEHLRDQILNHTIAPNKRLVEAQIAKSLGISRTPVREALHLLEKDGFIDAIPRVGYCVRKLAIEELNEIIEIREVNEILACRWAIRRIDKKDISAMKKNILNTRQMLEDGDPSVFVKQDEQFHEILVRSAGSEHLYQICQQLRRLMQRYRLGSMNSIDSLKEAIAGHERVLECLEKKDEESLVKALRGHLHYSKDDILDFMRRYEQENAVGQN